MLTVVPEASSDEAGLVADRPDRAGRCPADAGLGVGAEVDAGYAEFAAQGRGPATEVVFLVDDVNEHTRR